MKKTCLLALAAGLACCAMASAKPPKIEKFNGQLKEAVPDLIGKVKMVNGKIIPDGPMMPYTGNMTRNPMINAVAWDSFGRLPGTALGSGAPGTGCPTACPAPFNPDTGWRYWFGSSYANPNTLDNCGDMNCPPGAALEQIDLTWTMAVPGPITMLFFFYQDILDGACQDPALFTGTGGGVQFTYSTIPAGSWYSNVSGISGLGVAMPSLNVGANGFASGSYQWIMASSVTATQITLFAGPSSQFLWGTGADTGDTWRPGTHNAAEYDDDNPTDGVFDPLLECYDYSNACPLTLGKMVAFGYLRCPADFNNDGFVDGIDYDLFNAAFESFDPAVQIVCDLNGDCFVDGIDYDYFNAEFESLCP